MHLYADGGFIKGEGGPGQSASPNDHRAVPRPIVGPRDVHVTFTHLTALGHIDLQQREINERSLIYYIISHRSTDKEKGR